MSHAFVPYRFWSAVNCIFFLCLHNPWPPSPAENPGSQASRQCTSTFAPFTLANFHSMSVACPFHVHCLSSFTRAPCDRLHTSTLHLSRHTPSQSTLHVSIPELCVPLPECCSWLLILSMSRALGSCCVFMLQFFYEFTVFFTNSRQFGAWWCVFIGVSHACACALFPSTLFSVAPPRAAASNYYSLMHGVAFLLVHFRTVACSLS